MFKFNFDNLYAKIGMHQLTVEAFAGFTSNGFTYNGGASRSGSGFLLGGGYQDSLGDDLYWNAEYVYYESLADSSIPKNLMISKIFSHEIMGQSTSNRLYKDVEKSVQKLISMLIDQWYKDNPMKQF